MMVFFKSIVFVLIALACLPTGWSHAYVKEPMSRQLYSKGSYSYSPNGANGPGVCGGRGGEWYAGPEGEHVNGIMKTPLTTLVRGRAFNLTVFVTAPHLGVFTLELCRPRIGDGEITNQCFSQRLPRDPTDTYWSPYNTKYPGTVIFVQDSCVYGTEVTVRFLLPASVPPCDHCILRWYWQTGNSCAALPELSHGTAPSWITDFDKDGCKINFPGNYIPCGDDCPTPHCQFEQFKNCMDIDIV